MTRSAPAAAPQGVHGVLRQPDRVPGRGTDQHLGRARRARPGSSARRRFETDACNEAVARGGGSVRHNRSIIRSTDTMSQRPVSSSASTASCRGPPKSVRFPSPSASTGPSTRRRGMIWTRVDQGDLGPGSARIHGGDEDPDRLLTKCVQGADSLWSSQRPTGGSAVSYRLLSSDAASARSGSGRMTSARRSLVGEYRP